MAPSVDNESIEVSLITPLALRIGLGLVGAFLLVVATAELWRGVWPPSIVSPFFGLILFGAWAGGGGLLLASLFGHDEVWLFEQGQLTIRKSLRRFRSLNQYRMANIADVSVKAVENDGAPDSYCLMLRLLDGTLLKSPQFGTRDKAERARALLAQGSNP